MLVCLPDLNANSGSCDEPHAVAESLNSSGTTFGITQYSLLTAEGRLGLYDLDQFCFLWLSMN